MASPLPRWWEFCATIRGFFWSETQWRHKHPSQSNSHHICVNITQTLHRKNRTHTIPNAHCARRNKNTIYHCGIVNFPCGSLSVFLLLTDCSSAMTATLMSTERFRDIYAVENCVAELCDGGGLRDPKQSGNQVSRNSCCGILACRTLFMEHLWQNHVMEHWLATRWVLTESDRILVYWYYFDCHFP